MRHWLRRETHLALAFELAALHWIHGTVLTSRSHRVCHVIRKNKPISSCDFLLITSGMQHAGGRVNRGHATVKCGKIVRRCPLLTSAQTRLTWRVVRLRVFSTKAVVLAHWLLIFADEAAACTMSQHEITAVHYRFRPSSSSNVDRQMSPPTDEYGAS